MTIACTMRPRLHLPLLSLLTCAHLAPALPQLRNDQTVLSQPVEALSNPLKPIADHSIHSLASLPSHRIRLRSPRDLCDPSVDQVSGYLDTARGHHFFFWQFDSRNDPENDPLVLWLNGGPGCSSFTGLVQELGPCRIQPDGKDPVFNPYSWTNNASVIFLDQPVGVGFSYGDKGDRGIYSTEAAAVDVYAFLQIFFETFASKFGNSEFFIAGESFGGRYIPVFADYILKQNQLAESCVPTILLMRLMIGRKGLRNINLVSIMIGNGFTNPLTQYASYYPTVCTNQTGYGPYVSPRECRKMREALPRCQSLVRSCWDDLHNSALCVSASVYCETRLTSPYFATGRSSYDMTKFGGYEEEGWIAEWLNREDVRHELGVDLDPRGHGVKKFKGCSGKVFNHFDATGDGVKPSHHHVSSLLNAQIPVLLYVGTKDFICNWFGNNEWALELEWDGAGEFRAQELRTWYATEKEGKRERVGVFRQAGGFAFATVEGAGHFVPYDKPREALALFNSWVFERKVGFSSHS
ncbi:putative serine carboxypeptidase [Rhodotorula toruloides]|nr:putative serine carboxypeptidase [Rhodotorula toruloides]